MEMKRVIIFVQHSQSTPTLHETPLDSYLFQVIRNEKEVNAAKSHLRYAQEDVDPQSETQNVISDGARLQMQVDTTYRNATIVR